MSWRIRCRAVAEALRSLEEGSPSTPLGSPSTTPVQQAPGGFKAGSSSKGKSPASAEKEVEPSSKKRRIAEEKAGILSISESVTKEAVLPKPSLEVTMTGAGGFRPPVSKEIAKLENLDMIAEMERGKNAVEKIASESQPTDVGADNTVVSSEGDSPMTTLKGRSIVLIDSAGSPIGNITIAGSFDLNDAMTKDSLRGVLNESATVTSGAEAGGNGDGADLQVGVVQNGEIAGVQIDDAGPPLLEEHEVPGGSGAKLHGDTSASTGEGGAAADKEERSKDAEAPRSEATIPPMSAGVDDPSKLTGQVVPIGTSETPLDVVVPSQTGAPAGYVPTTNLRLMIEQVLKEKLTDKWPLEAYGQRVKGAIERSTDNFTRLTNIEKTVATLEESDAIKKKGMDKVTENIDHAYLNFLELHDETKALTKEVKALKKQLQEHKDYSFLLQSGFNGRLDGLEELRRLESQTRMGEHIAALNAARAEGFQACALYFAARGLFPKFLLQDRSFTELLLDKDEVLRVQNEAEYRLNKGGNVQAEVVGSSKGQTEETRQPDA